MMGSGRQVVDLPQSHFIHNSTLYTVTTLSQAARQCLSELREDLDSVIADALTVAATDL